MLAADFIFSTRNGAWVIWANGQTEYNFPSPQEGDAYLYARVLGFFDGLGSWHVILNHRERNVGHTIKTTKNWEWKTDDRGALARQKLIKGLNTIRVMSREAAQGRQVFRRIDIISRRKNLPSSPRVNSQ